MKFTKEVERAANVLEAAAKRAEEAKNCVFDELQFEALIDDFAAMDVTSNDLGNTGFGGLTLSVISKHFQLVTARKAKGNEMHGEVFASPSDLFVAIRTMVEENKAHRAASDAFLRALSASVKQEVE